MKDLKARAGRVYVHPASIEHYAKKTWEFAKAILWNNDHFNPNEVQLILDYVAEYYRSLDPLSFRKHVGSYFESFCERILAAQHFVVAHKNCRLKHPCIWLNPLNPNGFNREFTWVRKPKAIKTKKNRPVALKS